MSLALSLALFFVIWWITLFVVLPFGVRTQEEAGSVVPGTPPSAPANFRLARVFAINTVVAVVAFAVVWSAVTYRWLPLGEPTGEPTATEAGGAARPRAAP
jgi:predicted secreted protein